MALTAKQAQAVANIAQAGKAKREKELAVINAPIDKANQALLGQIKSDYSYAKPINNITSAQAVANIKSYNTPPVVAPVVAPATAPVVAPVVAPATAPKTPQQLQAEQLQDANTRMSKQAESYYNSIQKPVGVESQESKITEMYNQKLSSEVNALKQAITMSKGAYEQQIKSAPQAYQPLREQVDVQKAQDLQQAREITAAQGTQGGDTVTGNLQIQASASQRMNDLNLQQQNLINDANNQINLLESQGKMKEAQALADNAAQKLQAVLQERQRVEAEDYNRQSQYQNQLLNAANLSRGVNQDIFNKSLSEAQLTGDYLGKKTLEGRKYEEVIKPTAEQEKIQRQQAIDWTNDTRNLNFSKLKQDVKEGNIKLKHLDKGLKADIYGKELQNKAQEISNTYAPAKELLVNGKLFNDVQQGKYDTVIKKIEADNYDDLTSEKLKQSVLLTAMSKIDSDNYPQTVKDKLKLVEQDIINNDYKNAEAKIRNENLPIELKTSLQIMVNDDIRREKQLTENIRQFNKEISSREAERIAKSQIDLARVAVDLEDAKAKQMQIEGNYNINVMKEQRAFDKQSADDKEKARINDLNLTIKVNDEERKQIGMFTKSLDAILFDKETGKLNTEVEARNKASDFLKVLEDNGVDKNVLIEIYNRYGIPISKPDEFEQWVD